MTVKNRLIEFLKYKHISQAKFAKMIGVSSGFVNAIRVSIHPDKIHSISTNFPELNIQWLLTGKGDMLLSDGMQDAIPADGDEIERLKQQIASLNKEIELKDCLIAEKERFIQALLK